MRLFSKAMYEYAVIFMNEFMFFLERLIDGKSPLLDIEDPPPSPPVVHDDTTGFILSCEEMV